MTVDGERTPRGLKSELAIPLPLRRRKATAEGAHAPPSSGHHGGLPIPTEALSWSHRLERRQLLLRNERLEAALSALVDDAMLAWRALVLARSKSISDEHLDAYEQGLRFALRDARWALERERRRRLRTTKEEPPTR